MHSSPKYKKKNIVFNAILKQIVLPILRTINQFH